MTDMELPQEDRGRREKLQVRFTGNGGEYFRIWIVNQLLSAITLGIYSAWAKVRRKCYFYEHTEIDGECFEYHGSPIAILKGRAILVAAGVLIYVCAVAMLLMIDEFVEPSSSISPVWILLLYVLLFGGAGIVIAYITAYEMRFNAAVSSWRGIRFGFDGTWRKALTLHVIGSFMNSTIILAPLFWFKRAQFLINGHRLGRARFTLGAKLFNFYLVGVTILFTYLSVLLGTAAKIDDVLAFASERFSISPTEAIFIASFCLGVFLAFTVSVRLAGLLFRATYGSIKLGESTIDNSLSLGQFIFVAVTNVILVVITLGLYYPWARIRMVRLKIESLEITTKDIEGFVAAEREYATTHSEELGKALNFRVGL